MKKRLILASSSKPRQSLLQRLQIPFEISVPDVDETPLPNETPSQLVIRLAELKARTVADKFPNAIIIGADQVGVLSGQIQGKPHTHENAVKQLEHASGKRMRFFIGLCVMDTHSRTHQIALEEFDVIYRKLTHAMIEKYLQKEQPFECAGSCKAEGLGIALIQQFQGTDFTALIGLPLIRLVSMLEHYGIDPLDST
jgi:septum formation protein